MHRRSRRSPAATAMTEQPPVEWRLGQPGSVHDPSLHAIEVAGTEGEQMRVDYHKVHPVAVRAMLGLERAVHDGPLEALLLELIKVRASQLNGCAHCLEMHTKDARALGESDDRLHLVAAWREAPGTFTSRERAALAWCEELTLLPTTGASDEVYEEVRAQFSEE